MPGLFQHTGHEPPVCFPVGASMGLFAIVRVPVAIATS